MAETSQLPLGARASQATFYALLHALAEPGTIRRLPADAVDDTIPTTALIPLALADVEVGLSVDGAPEDPLAHRLAAATDARIVPVEEAWILVLTTADPSLVRRCETGSALEPERGARIAVRVADLEPEPPADHATLPGDSSERVVLDLTGPGVPGKRRLLVDGITEDFVAAVADANRNFPAGVDVWLVTDDGRTAALSRSTVTTLQKEN